MSYLHREEAELVEGWGLAVGLTITRHKKARMNGLCIELMVPRVGIEPTLPKEPDFESGASTNSATPATHQRGGIISVGLGCYQRVFVICELLN